ncbi:CoA ester lyase [Maricurvus nonylphenolicus]|uniref:HpcH/HpaI aldolase/citrate lyase family protein n=1 Tax=Maricurvus nonylphenolicus TaxID=1008307 RepID=UPI0036F19B75
MHQIRPRRSALYMPGSNARALEKAKTLDADALILDLEDAVAPSQKDNARNLICEAVNQGGYGYRELVIRSNGLNTPWGKADLEAAAKTSADAVCLPKVESADEIKAAIEILNHAGAPESLGIWIMIETPRGVLDIDAICADQDRLQVVVMGTSDLSKELRVPHTPDRLGFITSLSQCVLAARAHSLDIIDGVHLDLSDEQGYLSACEQGRHLGFDGKSLIHPKQIQPANDTFGLTEGAAEQAQKIIDAWQQATSEGQGVVVVDGKLVENLHVEEAQRTLAIAQALSERN